jgi:hypothetical protein
MHIRSGNTVLPPAVFDQPGTQSLTRALPVSDASATLTFQLDRALEPDSADPRQRGIIVADFAFE